MHVRTTARIAPVALILLLGADALAQSVDRDAAEAISLSGSSSGSYRSKANDWMIMPSGTTTLAGTLKFITADAGLGDTGLRFTDVVLLGLRARQAFKKRYELFIGASFLPKQPSFTDELEWQGASAGLRVGLGSRYASYLTVSGGPLLGRHGDWLAGAVGGQVRKSLHETLVFEGGAGVAYTSLLEDERSRASRLMEATASGELVFRAPNGAMAGWFGTEFRFPVVDYSQMSDAGLMPYDPQTRVNVHLGVVLSYIDDWDVFAKIAFIDRGDQVDPATTLPILDGGFDQQHVLVGVTRRFRPDDEHRDHHYIAE